MSQALTIGSLIQSKWHDREMLNGYVGRLADNNKVDIDERCVGIVLGCTNSAPGYVHILASTIAGPIILWVYRKFLVSEV